jgi:hypothetical protein
MIHKPFSRRSFAQMQPLSTKPKRNFMQQIKRKQEPILNSYSPELRGFAQNRFGGHQAQRLRSYGGSFGPASPCRQLGPEKIKAIEDDLRKRGLL